jgi:hypothetical protein
MPELNPLNKSGRQLLRIRRLFENPIVKINNDHVADTDTVAEGKKRRNAFRGIARNKTFTMSDTNDVLQFDYNSLNHFTDKLYPAKVKAMPHLEGIINGSLLLHSHSRFIKPEGKVNQRRKNKNVSHYDTRIAVVEIDSEIHIVEITVEVRKDGTRFLYNCDVNKMYNINDHYKNGIGKDQPVALARDLQASRLPIYSGNLKAWGMLSSRILQNHKNNLITQLQAAENSNDTKEIVRIEEMIKAINAEQEYVNRLVRDWQKRTNNKTLENKNMKFPDRETLFHKSDSFDDIDNRIRIEYAGNENTLQKYTTSIKNVDRLKGFDRESKERIKTVTAVVFDGFVAENTPDGNADTLLNYDMAIDIIRSTDFMSKNKELIEQASRDPYKLPMIFAGLNESRMVNETKLEPIYSIEILKTLKCFLFLQSYTGVNPPRIGLYVYGLTKAFYSVL